MRALRAVWERPRPAGAPRRGWRDWVLVGVLAVCGTIELMVRTDLSWRALSAALTLGLLPALLWRRSHPLLAVVVTFAATALAGQITGEGSAETVTLAYLLLLVHALFRWGSGRETVLGGAVIVAGVLLPAARGRFDGAEVVAGLAVVLAAAALGVAARTRARARARELEGARALERERIARELHDTVAHHVSAITIQAQVGLATAPEGPQRGALEVIETEAGRALVEMRDMLWRLREDETAELSPGRGIAELSGLAERSADGVVVEVDVDPGTADAPPGVSAAVYRIAQEAVTNARRHARGASRVRVRVAGDDDAVRVEVSDDGRAVGPAPAGFGITGMVERAEILGGTCQAGPVPGGGWTVSAVLPRRRGA